MKGTLELKRNPILKRYPGNAFFSFLAMVVVVGARKILSARFRTKTKKIKTTKSEGKKNNS